MSGPLPQTKRMTNALVGFGIPRRGLTVGTDRAVTQAAHREPAVIAEQADRIAATTWMGVVLRKVKGCGCVMSARVTTDPRHVGTVTTHTCPSYGIHQCLATATPTRQEQ